MLNTIALFSHLAAALGFAALGVALLFRRDFNTVKLSVGIASFLTAGWAACRAILFRYDIGGVGLLTQMETVRTAAWIAVLLLLQRRTWGLDQRPSSAFAVALVLGFIIALQLALGATFDLPVFLRPLGQQPLLLLFVALRLAVAISGLVLLHNLYINARSADDLSFRLLAVGLGLIFAYDLNLYTLHFLLGHPNLSLGHFRGAVDALAVPLLAMAILREGPGRFQFSRQAAFNTVSFTMIGGYLILMSFLAYGLRLTGGNWGGLLQALFIAAALMLGALVVLSPRARAELKVRIARNFYRYRYDYRVEWLRFLDTIDANAGSGEEPIRARLVRAVAAVLDCPGGALLEPADSGAFEVIERWHWPGLDIPAISASSAFCLYLAGTGRIVDFDALRAEAQGTSTSGSHGPLRCPAWAAADTGIWLAVPLVHRERLGGILLLRHSLALRDLNWEDYDLLRTLGRQGASYLAEAANQARLDEARSFDEFHRRFAFAMHDLKNVVSQLGLVARNAERHADNPEFRADMVATLNMSVTKMTDLMQLLGREAGGAPAARAEGSVDLGQVMATVVAAMRRVHPRIAYVAPGCPVEVPGDAGRLDAMATHLIQNAVDASSPGADIEVRLDAEGANARLIVVDHGVGMTPAFIRDELFKPFHSTKPGGFGIGAFEAREIARSHGGQLTVTSRPGEGSCFMVVLPRVTAKGKTVLHG
jgi:putative PEP-CTERM system histidine kinase